MTKADEPKKIFDVSGPGKSAPAPSSKPIIVTNRPILKDPMVIPDSEAVPAKPATKITVKPLGDGEAIIDSIPDSQPVMPSVEEKPEQPKTEEPKADTSEPAVAEKVTETKSPEAEATSDEPKTRVGDESKTKVNDPEPAANASTTEGKTTGATEVAEPKDLDADKDSSTETPETLDAAAKELAEHQAAIQKLIDSKQYVLPINAVENRRTKHFLVFGIIVIVILAAVWLDVALDAGLIHIANFKAPTHFFSN